MATIATLFSVLGLVAYGAAPQEVPDPRLEIPRSSTWIPLDSQDARTEIGPLHRPAGKVRRVIWYRANPPGVRENNLPKPWEQRVVQVFDEAGHCVEMERWSGYVQEFRQVARSTSASLWEFEENLGGFPYPDRWLEETIVDSMSRPLARLRTPLDVEGLPPPRESPVVELEWQYDECGRCCRELRRGGVRGFGRVREWIYDRQGRIERVIDQSMHHPAVTEFEYDVGGRLIARTVRYRGDPTLYRSEYDYDPAGRVVRSTEAVNRFLTRSVSVAYETDGKLIFRQTLDAPFGASASSTEETLDGIDRPIHREVFDADRRVTSRMSWTYDDDLRGNWIRKLCRAEIGACGADVRRDIEYAD